MSARYMPASGDIVKLAFDPQEGREQRGWRPALVLSSRLFSEATGLAMVCPITNTDRRFALHLPLPDGLVSTGVVMVDQVRSLDFRHRRVKFVEKAPAELLRSAKEILQACIEDEDEDAG